MSARFLLALADENPDLQREIGCAAGIFQMFDRQHLLSGKRVNGHNHRTLSSGNISRALSNRSSVEAEAREYSAPPQIVLEKNLSRNLNENHRTSVESSRTSFSSSSCSSFSFVDCNKSSQEENPSTDQFSCRERSGKGSPKSKNRGGNAQPTHRKPQGTTHACLSLDFRDVVKDYMHKDKDSHDRSVRTSPREKDMKNRSKLTHNDSPSSIQLPKSMDASHSPQIYGKSKMLANFGESLRALVKLKQAPRYFAESHEPPRRSYEKKDTSTYQVSKEAPRLSFDGSDLHSSVCSQGSRKIYSKFGELPRLSLDSRECCMRSSEFDSKLNKACRKVDKSSICSRSHITLERQQEPGSFKRAPSVIAKLMGLDAMPILSQDQVVVNNTNTSKSFDTSNKYQDRKMVSEKVTSTRDSKEDQLAFSPKCYTKESATQQKKMPDLKAENIAGSRVLIEPAAWKHLNGMHIPPKTLSGFKGPQKQQAESVYSVIEKRLKDLEFQKSNKDLRTLKHLLGAMQANRLLEIDKSQHEHSRASFHNTPPESDQNFGSTGSQSWSTCHSTLIKGHQTSRALEPPIVIMKPSRSFNSLDISPSLVFPSVSLPTSQRLQLKDLADKKTSVNVKIRRNQTPKSMYREHTNQQLSADEQYRKEEHEHRAYKRSSKLLQVSPRTEVEPREHKVCSEKALNSLSPRLQQKRYETEKQSRPPRPSPKSNVPSKHPANMYSPESASPKVRLTQKQAQAQEIDDQVSDFSSDTSCLNLQDNEKKSLTSKDISAMDQAATADEHRSPISILDASLCQDDLPPMRISSYASEDIEIQESVNWCNADSAHDAPSAKISSGFNQKKLENIEGLVQKLSQLSSSDGEAPAAAPIAFLCDDQGADHRYVSEIFLASGLLMLDVSSRPMSTQLQLHPSGHPINPDMFLVLEQTHSARLTKPDSAEEDSNRLKLMRERLHRKLVFDVVNELLIQKLKLASPGRLPDIPLQVRKAGFFSGRQVLKELCSEIDHLKAESFPAENCYGNNSLISCDRMLQHSEYWIDPSTELQMIALEMERSIFRDLIDESITEEGAFDFEAKATTRRQTTRQPGVKLTYLVSSVISFPHKLL